MTASPSLPPPELLLLRYGELALKKGNRRQFEMALARNVAAAARPISPVRVERRGGRMLVMPTRRVGQVGRRLQDVFGIKSISPAWGCESKAEAILELARAVFESSLAQLARSLAQLA